MTGNHIFTLCSSKLIWKLSHGRGVYDIPFAAIDHALEPVIQSEEGLLSAKHAAKCIKEHDALF